MICYRPGKESGKPDILSRRSDYHSGIINDEDETGNSFLKPSQFVISELTAQQANLDQSLIPLIQSRTLLDLVLKDILLYLQTPPNK